MRKPINAIDARQASRMTGIPFHELVKRIRSREVPASIFKGGFWYLSPETVEQLKVEKAKERKK